MEMNDILHANIFFVIASVATVVFCIVLTLVLYQLYKTVASARRVVERIEAASEQVADDLEHARELLYNGGMIARILAFMAGTKRKSRRRTSDD